ncbi:MAG: 30S ribosome-binding factor RbfA [Chloroflexi bacterium]|nr:30S ribosome-binding factor RbfA [Chloroflexota bacterium]
MSERTKRVDELLRQEIGAVIAREIADPRIGFVTITDVETTPDLRHAKVWVSVIGSAAERDAALTSLAHAMPFIRHELGGRLRIRRIPELHVRADDTLERGSRVLHLLNELEAGTDPADLPVTEDSLPTPVARLPHEGDAPDPELLASTEPAEPDAGSRHGRRFRGGTRRTGGSDGRGGPPRSGTAGPKPRKGRRGA